MRVLMFGWEFPPHISGGLGTACYGITKGLAECGTEVVFVVPSLAEEKKENDFLSLRSASGMKVREEHQRAYKNFFENSSLKNIAFRSVESSLMPYMNEASYQEFLYTSQREDKSFGEDEIKESFFGDEKVVTVKNGYGATLFDEVYRYAQAACAIALKEDFDIIHAHDWMTFPAAAIAKKVSNKKLVVHIHATEFDRSDNSINQFVYDMERMGFEAADVIIAVSQRTKDMVVNNYGIDSSKIKVVYNAVDKKILGDLKLPGLLEDEKVVLFMGRITYQKGPEYFVRAAKLVLDKIPDAHFIMAGSGDLMHKMVALVSELRMGAHFHFPGFLKPDQVQKLYALADVYVMPSVSEPFGIAPLESLLCGTPVLISKQSGVAEILKHSLKVDFWDIDELANKICTLLTYPQLSNVLMQESKEALKKISWAQSANSINSIYREELGV